MTEFTRLGILVADVMAHPGRVGEFVLGVLADKNPTARGLPVEPGGTGIDGLVVTRAYELPGTVATTSLQQVDGAS